MFTIMRLQITVGESYANLNTRKLHRLEILFSAGVGAVKRCWVNDWVWSYYSLVSGCTVNAAGNAVQLYGFINTRIASGVNVLVELSIVSSPITYQAKVYAINNEIEYWSTYPVTIGLLNTSRSLPTVMAYP